MGNDRQIVKASRNFRHAHSTLMHLCGACPNIHIMLLDEDGVAFAAITVGKDWAPVYAGHLIDHYGPPKHGEELPILSGVMDG